MDCLFYLPSTMFGRSFQTANRFSLMSISHDLHELDSRRNVKIVESNQGMAKNMKKITMHIGFDDYWHQNARKERLMTTFFVLWFVCDTHSFKIFSIRW